MECNMPVAMKILTHSVAHSWSEPFNRLKDLSSTEGGLFEVKPESIVPTAVEGSAPEVGGVQKISSFVGVHKAPAREGLWQ